ncbi:uncharacterized protein LOC132279907 [Cornus florida]|uniref:uncharacterized protein LOC132279907 n=1 Tax=Cornus florida TaxID=4283 RepID=UPI002899F99F|nr:uncharacterized protein LOC132279907 [Cornus florida]
MPLSSEVECHQSSTTVGFCLLPSELIQYIILNLALPEIVRLKSISKSIDSITSDENFIREYNMQSNLYNWLFIYKKRWSRLSVLHGFTDQSDRWFKISIAGILNSIVSPGEDLFLLTASGNYFLFALNTSREVISVNPMNNTVRKLPPSPLGPRGTSSWRRSSMKLLCGPSGSGHFRFLFAEMHENGPILFEYNSDTDKWGSMEARENVGDLPRGSWRGDHVIFLSAMNGRNESVILALPSQSDSPVFVRPRFDLEGNEEGQLAVGLSWGSVIDRLLVYGDGNMMIVRSDGGDDVNKRSRLLKGVELWGLSSNGRHWEFLSKVPSGVIEKIKKPYGVIVGCLEERDGKIRAVLMSNFEGIWDIIWLCYDIVWRHWTWVPIPECNMKGSNMAGISFSSGLTLS